MYNYVERRESMGGIQYKKNGICFRAILLVLICISLLSFSSNIISGSILQDSASACGTCKDALQSIARQDLLAGIIYVQYANISEDTQRLLRNKNNSSITTLSKLSYGFLSHTISSFISHSGHAPICKKRYFLIAPHSPNAPPFILS